MCRPSAETGGSGLWGRRLPGALPVLLLWGGKRAGLLWLIGLSRAVPQTLAAAVGHYEAGLANERGWQRGSCNWGAGIHCQSRMHGSWCFLMCAFS